MSTKINERLAGVINSNQAIFSDQSYYDFGNYEGFTLLQTKTLDLDGPLLDHVLDRALSCPMKSLPGMYDRLAYKMKYNRNLPYTERAETKLMKKYIADEHYDPVEIVRKYKAREYVNKLEMVTACIKAVEVKYIEKGRFFPKESLEKRVVSTLCEKLIKGPILSLFNTQAMTLGQVDTTKLIYNMSQCTDKDRFLMLDISKFCSSIEGDLVYDLFREFDDIYAEPGLFSNSYHYMEHAYVTTIDRFDPPLFYEDRFKRWIPLASDKGTFRSKRLLEGSMQKGWTIMLQIIIHIALLKFRKKVKYGLVGVGDNQVIKFTILDGYEWNEALQQDIHLSMIASMKTAGLKLKLEETYWSRYLMEFLKVTCVHGLKLSSRLKRMLTLGVESTDHLNTPLGRTSGIYAELTDVINESTSPAVSYFFGVVFSMFNFNFVLFFVYFYNVCYR